MWTPIFEQNKDNIVETLDEYIGNLKQFKKLMEEHKFDQVFDEMQETNHIATILKGIK
jgi:prephenate dehydrogenase